MRVLLSTTGTRGDVEPLVALAAQLRALGAEVRVCAPPDQEFAQRLAEVGVSLAPVGPPVRPLMHEAGPPSTADLSRDATEMIAAQINQLATAAEGCDALVAAGVMQLAARSVAEKLSIHYVYASYCPVFLRSPHHPPLPLPGKPFPPDVTDNRVLWDLDAESWNKVFGLALNTNRLHMSLPPVSDVQSHVLTDEPWLAADPILAPWRRPADVYVTQTGAWTRPDDRPLTAELEKFLDAGPPPVYVGFGSMRAPKDAARVAIEAIRAQGCRALVARGWADLAPIDDADDCFAIGEVNHQALFGRVAAVVHHGGAGTTTAAARAGAPQVVAPQMMDQRYWARRVAGLGIGTAHSGPTPTTESLSAGLKAALTPDTRARATAVAGAIRTDGAAAAAQLLLDTISREKSMSA